MDMTTNPTTHHGPWCDEDPTEACDACQPTNTPKENTMSRDYDIEDHEGKTTGVCGDCGTPAYFDTLDGQYHHAARAERGCFLIPSEERADDPNHPLYADYTTFSRSLVDLDRGDFLASISENRLGSLWRLRWTDGVCGDWTEHFYSLTAALMRLGVLEMASKQDRFFTTDEEQFNSQAHTFANTVLSDPI